MSTDLKKVIEELLREYSASAIAQEIKLARTESRSQRLTIIANAGLHSIPEQHLRGDVFNFSEGTLELGPEHIEETIDHLSTKLVQKLKSKRWKEIYLVPTGHPILSISSSLLIFRVTRIDPVIVSYFGSDGYRDVRIDTRKMIVSKPTDIF